MFQLVFPSNIFKPTHFKSLIHSFARSLTLTLKPLTHSLTRSLSLKPLISSLTQLLSHIKPLSQFKQLTHSLTHSKPSTYFRQFTHSLTHFPSYSI